MPNQNLIYSMEVPLGTGFAELISLYNPEEENLPVCASCGLADNLPPDHIDVQWVPGSDVIGDFTMAVGPVVVRAAIADELLERFQGFAKGKVRIPDHPKPKLVRQHGSSKENGRPYHGPVLCFIRISHHVPLLSRSTVGIEKRCDVCRRIAYNKVIGVEVLKGNKRVPRTPDQGLFVDKALLRGMDFFSPRYMSWTLCTERVKEYMESRKFNNILFLEVGELNT